MSWNLLQRIIKTKSKNGFPLFVFYSHSDLGGFIESVDPVDEILLVIRLQEELPHPGIDDYIIIKKKRKKK